MKRLPPLHALRAFDASVRTGRFTRAGETLHVTQGAISRQIKQLEDWLGKPVFVRHYQGRLVNIHPSLLPAFPGLHTHARALAAGCRFAGATVHLVTELLDQGPILAQAVVPVLAGDTAQELAARVLTQEHLIYSRAIEGLLRV
jgi:hypothetical protein